MKNATDIVSVSTSFRGTRTAKLTTLANGVLSVDLLDGDKLVRGQCFTANPASPGPERAAAMADAWIDGAK